MNLTPTAAGRINKQHTGLALQPARLLFLCGASRFCYSWSNTYLNQCSSFQGRHCSERGEHGRTSPSDCGCGDVKQEALGIYTTLRPIRLFYLVLPSELDTAILTGQGAMYFLPRVSFISPTDNLQTRNYVFP